jgi:hypothetical protein
MGKSSARNEKSFDDQLARELLAAKLTHDISNLLLNDSKGVI